MVTPLAKFFRSKNVIKKIAVLQPKQLAVSNGWKLNPLVEWTPFRYFITLRFVCSSKMMNIHSLKKDSVMWNSLFCTHKLLLVSKCCGLYFVFCKIKWIEPFINTVIKTVYGKIFDVRKPQCLCGFAGYHNDAIGVMNGAIGAMNGAIGATNGADRCHRWRG